MEEHKNRGLLTKFPAVGRTILRVFLFRHVISEADFELGRFIRNEVKVGDVTEELYARTRWHYGSKGGVHCGIANTATGKWIGKCDECEEYRKRRADAMKSGKRGNLSRLGIRPAVTQYLVHAVDITDPNAASYPMTVWRLGDYAISAIDAVMESRARWGYHIFGERGWDMEFTIRKGYMEGRMDRIRVTVLPSEIDLTGRVTGDTIDLLRKGNLFHPWMAEIIESEGASAVSDKEPEEKPKKSKRKSIEAGTEWVMNHPELGAMRVTVKDTPLPGEKIHVVDDDGGEWLVDKEDLKSGKRRKVQDA